jgi:uncharacterized protein (UPF0216 family)
MHSQVLYSTRKFLLLVSSILLISASTVSAGSSDSPASTDSPLVRTYGQEGGYRTEVTSANSGALSDEDRRQVSLLTAQVFQHIEQAQRALDGDNISHASDEVAMGQRAIKAVRNLLPTTNVHTKTCAPNGEVVYEDQRDVQEDRVPLFEGMLSTKTLAPIVAAKQDAVDVKGVRLIGAETITTEAFAHLDYIENQLGKSIKALKEGNIELAFTALSLAQVRGVEFRFRKEDTQLAAARDAIWLVKRALEENNSVQARANLNIARQQLEIYRQLLPEGHRQDVTQMMTEVAELDSKLKQDENGSSSQASSQVKEAERNKDGSTVIRWWEQINGWFKRRS